MFVIVVLYLTNLILTTLFIILQPFAFPAGPSVLTTTQVILSIADNNKRLLVGRLLQSLDQTSAYEDAIESIMCPPSSHDMKSAGVTVTNITEKNVFFDIKLQVLSRDGNCDADEIEAAKEFAEDVVLDTLTNTLISGAFAAALEQSFAENGLGAPPKFDSEVITIQGEAVALCSTSPMPSEGPSLSTQPSQVPSVSTLPSSSSNPSVGPSTSSQPSASSQPSFQPSEGPSLSTQPSQVPSDSVSPSSKLTVGPSISSQPSPTPTSNPTPIKSLPTPKPTRRRRRQPKGKKNGKSNRPKSGKSKQSKPTNKPSQKPTPRPTFSRPRSSFFSTKSSKKSSTSFLSTKSSKKSSTKSSKLFNLDRNREREHKTAQNEIDDDIKLPSDNDEYDRRKRHRTHQSPQSEMNDIEVPPDNQEEEYSGYRKRLRKHHSLETFSTLVSAESEEESVGRKRQRAHHTPHSEIIEAIKIADTGKHEKDQFGDRKRLRKHNSLVFPTQIDFSGTTQQTSGEEEEYVADRKRHRQHDTPSPTPQSEIEDVEITDKHEDDEYMGDRKIQRKHKTPQSEIDDIKQQEGDLTVDRKMLRKHHSLDTSSSTLLLLHVDDSDPKQQMKKREYVVDGHIQQYTALRGSRKRMRSHI